MILSKLCKYNKDEREFLIENIDKLKELMNHKKILLVFDRGYISTELLKLLNLKQVKYIFRCPNNTFSELRKSKTNDEIINIKITTDRTRKFKTLDKEKYINEELEVRLVKVKLDSGEEEYLITNLTKAEVSYDKMKDLYFKRWNIEKSFEIIKNKLKIENMGSRTENGVKQEFYACILLYNFLEDIKNQMNNDIKTNKGNKYEYKVNMNVLIGVLKPFLIKLINSNFEDINSGIEIIYTLISRNLVPIKPNRKNPRNKNRTSNKYRINHRDSF